MIRIPFVSQKKSTKKHKLHVYYQNIRGLRTKLKNFLTSSACNTSDVICISESWLNSAISDCEVIDKSFKLFRKDRDSLTSDSQRGGGVFIAVRSNISAELIIINRHNIEQVYIKVKCTGNDVIVGCVYIPPRSSLITFTEHMDTISYIKAKYPNSTLLITGDYNIPSSYPPEDCENLLYNDMILAGCIQINNILNNSGRLLDLCFSSIDTQTERGDSILEEDGHHPALVINICHKANLKPNNKPHYSFKRADFVSLNALFLQTNWIELYKLDSVEDKLNWLYSIINEGIAKHVPIHTAKTDDFPCWFSSELKNKIRLKKEAHAHYKKHLTTSAYRHFSTLRLQCKKLSTECYNNYVSRIENLLESDAKQFWKFIKNKRCNDLDIPTTMMWEEKTANTGDEITNLFASYFKSVYDTYDGALTNQPTDVQFECDSNLCELNVSFDEVFKQLRSLDIKKGAGPDGIPNILLRNCAVGLCEPITHIFDKSVMSGVFPRQWKLSYISPIHKSGPRSSITNYRPVCIQSALAKLFEKIVLPQLTSAFKNVISTKQHGFIKGRSTATNLYLYTDYILNAMNRGLDVHSLYTDFSKAFDTVDHDLLIGKLSQYGVVGKPLKWIQSYLTGRHLQVRTNGHISEEYGAYSGVPQGSHLGPILFNIFINDIASNLSSEYLLYADDMKAYRIISSDDDIAALQQDLDTLHLWCVRNKLKINIDKCAIMHFSRSHTQRPTNYNLGGQLLPKPTIIKDLGVLIDTKLDFNSHIDKIVSQATKVLGYIIRAGKDFKNAFTLVRLFNALVRPILEYCSVIWSPYTIQAINKIEKLQRKLCKFIAYRTRTNFTDEFYDRFHISTLSRRREASDLIFAFKILNGYLDSPEILEQFGLICSRPNLRSRRILETTTSTKSYVINGPRNRIANLVNDNSVNLSLFDVSLTSFVGSVKSLILS